MNSAQLQLDGLTANWNTLGIITYPPPPYMTLQMHVRQNLKPLTVRPRPLLDMINKYEDGGMHYIKLQEHEILEVYTKGFSLQSSIHDKRNKWITYNPVFGLNAQLGNNSEAARFEITRYSGPANNNKFPVTLKIQGTNQYLCCNAANQLTLENISDGSPATISESTKRLLFFQQKENVNTTFESANFPGMFLCTADGIESQVLIASGNDQQKIHHFVIDTESGSFIIVGKRLSLFIPLETLKILQRIYKPMANPDTRSASRSFGNSTWW